MELDIHLTRIDFYHFLMDRSYSRKVRNLARYVGALAVFGSVAVMVRNGIRQGIALMLLGIAFVLWTPFLLHMRAGKLENASKKVTKLHYRFDSEGFSLMPPGEKEKRILWKDLVGTVCNEHQIVIYKDTGHAYIFPRPQLKEPEAFIDMILSHTEQLVSAPLQKG